MSIMSLSGRSPAPASAAAAAGDTTPSDVGGQLAWATEDLEVVYEQRSLSEPIRLGKNGRVLGMAVNGITESTLAVWTSEGRVCLLEVQLGELEVDLRQYTDLDINNCKQSTWFILCFCFRRRQEVSGHQ